MNKQTNTSLKGEHADGRILGRYRYVNDPESVGSADLLYPQRLQKCSPRPLIGTGIDNMA